LWLLHELDGAGLLAEAGSEQAREDGFAAQDDTYQIDQAFIHHLYGDTS
jgi:hypothetical protein